MTKDDIIWGKEIEFESNGWESYFMPDQVLKAMDLFAKQQSIAFMRHCLEAGYLKPDENGSVQLDYNYWHESNFTKASEEIYTKFIEQQNKDNEDS